EKESFRMMLFYIGGIGPYSYWKNFLGSYTYEIDGIDHGESFHIINMRWVRKSSAEDENIPERRMRFYITQESEKWVFVNPVDAITSKWKIHSTDRIVFIYPPGVNIGDYRKEIEYLVEETENFIELFDLDKSIEITYFYAQSQREASEFFLQRPSNGYAVPWMNAAVSVTFDNYHEVIHTLHYGLEWNSGVNAFDEGLPVAFAGNTKTTAGMALIESRNFIRDNKFIPLSELLTNSREFFAKNYITYHESGAFVKFLIENYGAERLKSLCIYTRSSKDVFTSFKEIYGTTPEDLEESFKEYLMEVRVPEIETVVPENSDLIFSMTDPTGDDNGDGDYTYPNERFREGVFDLRKFEVLKDEINVYFRILFADMTEPVTYGSGGELFMPGAVIAINKGGNEDRPLRKYGDG
ncbi:MAG: hypothetical protein GY863_14975, partial [bacterium]|nr:hypothetical protein [bacterium]